MLSTFIQHIQDIFFRQEKEVYLSRQWNLRTLKKQMRDLSDWRWENNWVVSKKFLFVFAVLMTSSFCLQMHLSSYSFFREYSRDMTLSSRRLHSVCHSIPVEYSSQEDDIRTLSVLSTCQASDEVIHEFENVFSTRTRTFSRQTDASVDLKLKCWKLHQIQGLCTFSLISHEIFRAESLFNWIIVGVIIKWSIKGLRMTWFFSSSYKNLIKKLSWLSPEKHLISHHSINIFARKHWTVSTHGNNVTKDARIMKIVFMMR